MSQGNGLTLSPIQNEIVRETVLITGAPRSGTTLTGKIIATLQGLEYRFEPPGFYGLCAAYAAGKLELATAVQLVRIYLSEDHLLEAAHGRGLNMRERDDSHYHNQMPREELERRWSIVGNRADAVKLVRDEGRRLAVKMPNVLDAHAMLLAAMPGMKTVLVTRDGRDVVRSIVAKGWVSDAGLQADLWPYLDIESAVPIPYWVPEAWRQAWASLDEMARGCIMWSVHAQWALDVARLPATYTLRYERLIEAPAETVADAAGFLGSAETVLTRRRTSEIRTGRVVHADLQGASSLPAEIRNWFLDVNGRWGY